MYINRDWCLVLGRAVSSHNATHQRGGILSSVASHFMVVGGGGRVGQNDIASATHFSNEFKK